MKKYVKQQTFLVWVCFATTLGWGSLANAGSTEQKIKINPSIKKDLCQLKIDKKHTPDNFIYGDTGQYNIEITNPNKFSCSHIIIKDTLPENMTFISSSSPWSCTADSFNPQKVTCTLNSLAGSTSSVLSFKVNVPDEVNAKGKGWLKNEAKNCASVIANRSGPVSASISIIARKKPLRRSTSCDTVSVIPKDNKEFCEADVMMVIDKSNSMNGTLLQNEKNAAIFFANKAFSFPDNQVGVVSFHAFPTLDQPLTTNKPLVISAINRLRASGVTHIHRGLRKGLDEILANSVTPQRIVILLTDGRNVRAITDGMVRLDAINASNDGIIIYTIGYGNNINEDLLRFVASKTHGQYYSAPQNSQLEGIFDQISQDICTQKTNISGIKFHDMNGDGVQNTGEGPIENIQISLDSADSNGNSTGIAGITNTAADGSYSFSGIAPGTYIVRENIAALPGWTQTFPTANNGVYFVTLTEGQQINHLNFGNANCGNLCDATVSGIKYYDTNHNGIYDAGETKLSGWLIEMIHSDGSFSFDVTDSNGDYSINIPHTMLAETVTLSEWMQPFWVAVAPVAGTYPSIPVTTGDQLTHNFGNVNICDIDETTGGPNQCNASSAVADKYSDLLETNYPDLVASVETGKQVVIKNIGKGPADRVALLIKGYTETSTFKQLSDWNCSSNTSMNQISCRYKSTLLPGEKIVISLPVEKMMSSTFTVFAEYELNQNNNRVEFSEVTPK